MQNKAAYMSGFGNDFETESLAGALPQGQNSPQNCAYGLYAEQLSGSPFTAPRGTNERSWLYRIRPSVKHTKAFTQIEKPDWKSADANAKNALPLGQYRWDPLALPTTPTSFIDGIKTITVAGDVNAQSGMAAHVYLFNTNMSNEYFFNADGEMLVVPQIGELTIFTEMGIIELEPNEIAVLPRGMMFKVSTSDDSARGYICENYGAKLTLPDRGPIGANCLANPRDFKTPALQI